MEVDSLLDTGLDPAAAYECAWTPLLQAISSNQFALASALLLHEPYKQALDGSDPIVNETIIWVMKKFKKHFACETLSLLIDSFNYNPLHINSRGENMLFMALRKQCQKAFTSAFSHVTHLDLRD